MSGLENIVFILFLWTSPFAHHLFAADYYVNDAALVGDVFTTAVGNDANLGTSASAPKATVSDVIADYVLGPNDNIYVDAGTYTQSFTFTSADQGTAAGYVKVIGAGSALTIFNAAAASNNADIINANYIWIEKINFVNATANEHNIVNQYGQYTNIRNCKLDVTSTAPSTSINIYFKCNTNSSINANYSSVLNNVINSSAETGRGVYLLGDADYCTISANNITMTGSLAFGMYFKHHYTASDQYWPVYNTVSNNVISSVRRGISLQGDSNGPNTLQDIHGYTITGNSITITASTNAENSCIWMDNVGNHAGTAANTFTIEKNRLTNGWAGIFINDWVERVYIYNNYICGNKYGLYSNNYDGTDTYSRLYHNSLYTTQSCVRFENDSQDYWDIRNNILFTTSSSSSDACIYLGQHTPDFYNTDYNLLWAPNGASYGRLASGPTNYTFATWKALNWTSVVGTNNDQNSMNKAPAYQNAASCDLDLLKDVTNYPYPGQSYDGYPQGTNLIATVGTDIKGTSRTEPTIGAFEFNSTLPITLLSFDAQLVDRRTELQWVTASEKNNDYFNIERSYNGTDWEFLDQVDGAGNSTELLSYHTYDFNPYRGITYYRLKQVDFDGKYSYSEIRSVANTDDLMILPNPSTGIFGIGGMPKHQENTIAVLDITGKVLEQHATEEESFQLDLTQRSAGVYMVIINGTESIKLIKE
jgi:hypothetical protein